MRLVYRVGVLQRFDKVAGIPLGAATAAITLYVALVGVIALDGWLAPLHGTAAIGPQQMKAMQALAATNPTLAAFADPTMLNEMATAAAKAAIPPDQLAKYDAALGEKLPMVGQHVDFPKQ